MAKRKSKIDFQKIELKEKLKKKNLLKRRKQE